MSSTPSYDSDENISLWEIQNQVEVMYPHFLDIDVCSPDFNVDRYMSLVTEMLDAARLPIRPFSLSWNNLSCAVPVHQSIFSKLFDFTSWFSSNIVHGFSCATSHHPAHHHHQPQKPTAELLSDVSGYVYPGQLCLVMGPSGSGTSLLLSLIAGRTIPSLIRSDGQVLYGGESKLGGLVRPSHFAHFVQQEDHHIPNLTVRQTLQFAADCRWPSWIPYAKQIRRNDVLMVARILGIERTLDTIVGSDLLRGVSGGERKRVTIGEMGIGLIGGTMIMDNWSKGLDSGTTLSITRSLREYADDMKGTAVVSMQAPGTEIFNLFDTVCLLHEGHLIYFGPISEAEAYANSLGFQRPPYRSLPDFLSSLADSNMRGEYVASPMTTNQGGEPPRTGSQFSECFARSKYKEQLSLALHDISLPENRRDISDLLPTHKKIVQRPSLQSIPAQIAALTIRQVKWLQSVRKSVVAQFVQNLILGILLGSIFWQLPDSLAGAGSRSGIIFLAILFIGISSLSTFEEKYIEKVVFMKQNKASFFQISSFLFVQYFFDFILELGKAICLMVPVYTMAGLNIGTSGQRLGYAVILVTLVSQVMLSIVRFLVGALNDPSSAQGVGGLITITFVLLSGYMKSSGDLQGYLVWVYWINPIHYALESLLINEFSGRKIECSLEEKIPRNSAILPDFRVCPIETGEQYIQTIYDISNGNLFQLYYFLVLIGFSLIFFVCSAISTRFTKPRGYAQRSSQYTSNEYLKGRRESHVSVTLSHHLSNPSLKAFTFSNMTYSVDKGRKVLLDHVTGSAIGGEVMLLMGESGAGKTTLLDVCAMRKTLGKGTSMEGELRLNGQLLSKKTLAHVSGYCEQSDIHVREATVREAVMFSANLRLPKSMTMEDKKRRVQDTISLLSLEIYSSVLVGALGSGEKKLLTMALEVVADPKVLFLDEPTSGLSSPSAMIVAKALRNVAKKGTCIICTIHQPSAEVFNMFDRLLLLKRGGKVVYYGDIGQNGSSILSYFEGHGAGKMREGRNVADWMLNVIADEKTDWTEEWKHSDEKKTADGDTHILEGLQSDTNINLENLEADKVGFGVQLRNVLRREFWRYWRLPEYNLTRVILLFVIALLIGILYLREISDTQLGANLSFAALFLTLIPSTLIAQNVISPTVRGRAVFYRETAGGIYRSIAHHLSVGIVELPFSFVATTVFAVVYYFMVGLDSGRFGYFFLASHLLYIFSVYFGVMLASITPSAVLATTLVSSLLSLLIVLSGFFIRKNEMPGWWLWATWINPYSYYLSGVVLNQMSGKLFKCEPEELARFPLPTGFSSCKSIPGGDDYELITSEAGSFCLFCPISSGRDLIDDFSADDVNKWVSLLALVGIIAVCRIITSIGFAKFRFLSR